MLRNVKDWLYLSDQAVNDYAMNWKQAASPS